MSEAAAQNAPPPDAGAGAPPEEALPRKFGKYTLLRRLATGGMAELYLSLHRSIAGFERLVVIKRILPEMARDQGFITMLLQEARIAATFSHPNIVTTFDVGQAEGTYFIAMEHIHGEDLRSVVRSMKPKGQTEFPLEHAVAIVSGAAAGLAYAHEKKDLDGNPLHVVHRDISPQNILVTFTGDVKVVDFGIAKANLTARRGSDAPPPAEPDAGAVSGEVARGEHGTKAGQLKGKIPYMSPEQARGEPLDARSDVFSLGIILFELSTGRRLFRGPNELETLKMITDGEYPHPSQVNPRVSPRLEAVILKALARDREDRYENARELQSDLEAVVHQERIPVSTVALGKWMQFLFEERLAAQREALAQGKQLADVLSAEDPENFTEGGTGFTSLGATPAPASRKPLVATVLVFSALLAGALGFVVHDRNERLAEERARALVNTGTIAVRSTPAGAHIWLNGAATPYQTPFDLPRLATGPAARYEVRVTAEGYEPYTQNVVLPVARTRATVDAALVRARASAYAVLSVRSTPPGATVLVDGREVEGRTPLTVPELQPGVEHAVVVRREDCADQTFTFVGAAGQVENREVTLAERPLAAGEAFLELAAEPPTARVRVGDREYATGSPYHIRVPSDRVLSVQVSAPGYEAETRTARARSGETLTLRPVRLERPDARPRENRTPGRVTVGARGAWCNVTIDGRSYGQTPVANITLPPGRHTIVCANPTRGTQTRRIELAPGGVERVRIDFP